MPKFANRTYIKFMNEKEILSNLNSPQQEIYIVFNNIYPSMPSSGKDFFLKLTHMMAQYQINLDNSDKSLLLLLPPEPKSPTAMQIALELYNDNELKMQTLDILLPFIMYDLANPKSGSIPQCSSFNSEVLNQFELIIAASRKCMNTHKEEHNDQEVCKDLIFSKLFISEAMGEYDELMDLAKKFLGIHNLED